MASDEYFRCPLTSLGARDEGGFWFSDLATIYVRYVSDDASFGLDMSLWPVNFTRLVEAYLADQTAPRIAAASTRLEPIETAFKAARAGAPSTAASVPKSKARCAGKGMDRP